MATFTKQEARRSSEEEPMDTDVPQPTPVKDISTPSIWSTIKEDNQPKFGTQYIPKNPPKLPDPGTLTSKDVFCEAPTTGKLVVQARATDEANNRHIYWNHWTNEYQISKGVPFEIMVQKADPGWATFCVSVQHVDQDMSTQRITDKFGGPVLNISGVTTQTNFVNHKGNHWTTMFRTEGSNPTFRVSFNTVSTDPVNLGQHTRARKWFILISNKDGKEQIPVSIFPNTMERSEPPDKRTKWDDSQASTDNIWRNPNYKGEEAYSQAMSKHKNPNWRRQVLNLQRRAKNLLHNIDRFVDENLD